MAQAEHREALFAERVIAGRLWGASPFFLLDVGCSGGIEQRWRIFGDRLRAIGFDPLVAEIDRLNAANTHAGVSYVAAFITAPDYESLFPRKQRDDLIASKNDDPFQRVSAVAAQSRAEVSYVQEQFNSGAPVVMSDRTLALDDAVHASERAQVDFLKIDTDGHDIEAVLGADAIMAAGGILGLKVEVQLHGAIHPYANTFANIDRVLRERGFTLFDLSTYRYSRSHLPAPFVWDITAQTTSGQVVWGDAIYFRDLGSLDYERMWTYEISPERVLKLACLFDLFDLPDCAAELLVNRGRFLPPAVRDDLLDLLATGEPGSYARLVASFEKDFKAFFPSRLRAQNPAADVDEEDTEGEAESKLVRHLRARLVSLGEKNASLRERLKTRSERVEQLTKRLERKQK
jgi:hypothetical protein